MLHKSLLLISLALLSAHCRDNHDDKNDKVVELSDDLSDDEWALLENADLAWATHGIDVSADPELSSQDLSTHLTMIKKTAQVTELVQELKRTGCGEILASKGFNVFQYRDDGKFTFSWKAGGNLSEALEFLKLQPTQEEGYSLAVKTVSDAWKKHGVTVYVTHEASVGQALATLKEAIAAADDPRFVDEIKRLQITTFSFYLTNSYNKVEGGHYINWKVGQSREQFLSYMNSLTVADGELLPPVNEVIPSEERTQKMIEASNAWVPNDIEIISEADISNEDVIAAFEKVKAAAGRADLLQELRRLKVTTIQISTEQFDYMESEDFRVVTWKHNHSADQFLSYLKSIDVIQ